MNWSTTTTGTNDVAWPTGGTANFGTGSGTAGTVTVSGSVTVGAITFSASAVGNYLITGGTIALNGGTSTITTNTNAEIDSILAGTSGMTKSGTGTLTLGGSNNTYSGTTTVSAGVLCLSNSAALPGEAI